MNLKRKSIIPPEMMHLLRYRLVQVILLSFLLLQIGVWVRNLSVLLFVMEKTHNNPTAVSLIYVAQFAPILILSFVGGTFADRWQPKRTMIWCDLLSAISIVIVFLTLMLGTWKAVFFATLISATLSQFSYPSIMKLYKIHIPEKQIQLVIALFQTCYAAFMFLGPVLGTYVYQHFGIYTSIAVMSITFLLSAGVLFFLPDNQQMKKETAKTSLLQEMVGGVRYILSKKRLLLLGTIQIIIGLSDGVIYPLTIFIVTEQLGLSKEYIQWMMAATGLGMFLGGLSFMALSTMLTLEIQLIIGLFFTALGLAVTGFSSLLWLTLFAEFVVGLMIPILSVSMNTLILQHTETSFVGRVNGLIYPLYTGSLILAMSLAAPLKKLSSLFAVFETSAILSIIGVCLTMPLYFKRIKQKRETYTS